MADHRNILLITTDQHHHECLGVRNPALATPNLDRLAAEGMLFDRAYCPNPLCSPSRASILTGQYPSSHGCWTIGTKLDEETPTVSGLLSATGYASSLIGKAHFQPLASTPEQTSLEAPPRFRDLEFWRSFHGPYYGFEHIELARNHADEAWAGQHYALWMESHGFADWREHFRSEPGEPGRRHRWELPEEHHYTTFVTERSIAAIERAVTEQRPFFTWASFQDPHPPYLVSEPWASRYDPADVPIGRPAPGELELMPPWHRLTQQERPDFGAWRETPFANHGFHSHLITEDELRRDVAVYYGMISFVDAGVGRILAALDRLGIAEDTLVVFTTDHGHFLGQHGLIAKGAFHYEDLLRIPMIVRAPGVPAGSRSPALQSLVDLAPTFLSAAGLEVPAVMQGVDQWPVWTGAAETARDHVLVENRHQPTRVHLRSYVEGRYKITIYRDQPYGELFDLVDDPGELRNRYDDPAYAGVRAELTERFLNAELARERSRYPRIAIA
ncbi:MAG TPA: sulfatase-like hydrolase/transferase [Microlunatus sp.]|nr:sulfatase-like hydrolase/transferase [Microlunatus sp.]